MLCEIMLFSTCIYGTYCLLSDPDGINLEGDFSIFTSWSTEPQTHEPGSGPPVLDLITRVLGKTLFYKLRYNSFVLEI